MSNKIRAFFLSLTIVALVVFSAVGTTIVYADDESITATPEPGTTPTSLDGQPPVVGTETPLPPTDTSGTDATAVTSVDGQPTATETTEAPADTEISGTDIAVTSADAPPPAETPVAVLEQVPDNTTVTVLNSDGEQVPLASQDAANAIASTYDPIWCPAGQPPIPGANGCTQSFSSFDALLNSLSGNATYQGAGIIYVQQGQYAGGEAIIDISSSAYDLSNIKDFDLTVQGGWNTTDNSVDPANSTTFKYVPITVGTADNPWGGSLTFNNINIMWVDGQTALTLNSKNDISLSNVEITRTVNGSGAELNAGGNVTINNSNFDDNGNAGAVIEAVRNVNIANSTFSNLSNRITEYQEQSTGVQITSGGSVSLYNVYANANREVGANINAGGDVTIGSMLGCAHTIVNSESSNANNCSSFSGTKFSTATSAGVVTFYGYGLQVFTPGTINIDLITANDNFLWGADLNAGRNVTISNSLFNGNTTDSRIFIDDTGLLIKSSGNVSLDNVQANNNRLYGAVINTTGTGNVSISNSFFSNNRGTTVNGGITTFFGYGLQVGSDGSIFLNGVTASNNNLAGAQLDAGGDVAINNGTFSNNSTGSSTNLLGRGLEVTSKRNVFLTNVIADKNQLYGANVQANSDVYLDSITATNNGEDGIVVKSNCNTVFLGNGTYSNNGQYGLKVINSALDQSSGLPVFANNGVGNIFEDPGTCVFSAPLVTRSSTTDPSTSETTATNPTNSELPTIDASTVESSITDVSGSDAANENSSTLIAADLQKFVSQNSGNPINMTALVNYHAGAKMKVTHEGKVTLNSILANNSKTFTRSFVTAGNDNVTFGIFSGKYIYVNSASDGTVCIHLAAG